LLSLYPPEITRVQFNLLGSHDTPRFKTLVRGDTSAYRLATLFQMTYPGAPSIYYGDEIGMSGVHDPGCRGGFPWDENGWDRDLHGFVRRCTALRHAHPALRWGKMDWLFAGQGVVVYLRHLDQDESRSSDALIVAINNTRRPVILDVPVGKYLVDGTIVRAEWDTFESHVADGRIGAVRIPARAGTILQVVPPSA